MHDPLTQAFRINFPWFRTWKSPSGHKFRSWVPFITIWHKDPERDGSDNSCDWCGSKRKLTGHEKEFADAVWDLATILDNRPYYPDHPAHKAFESVKKHLRELRKVKGWRVHPRWHIHHWRIQVHPWQTLRRWLFERCAKCGKGYSWGYCPVGNWSGTQTWHRECDDSAKIADHENTNSQAEEFKGDEKQ